MTWLLILFFPWTVAARPAVPEPDWTVVDKRLVHAGLSRKFIKSLRANYESDDFRQVIELNTLLFLKKTDYHSPQVDDAAVTSVRGFLATHHETFAQARAKYKVAPEVIASLLWIESRHGQAEGEFHVPSVFIDLVQVDRPEVIAHLNFAAHRFTPKVTRKVKRDIALRAHRRVKWALGELKALEKMWRRDAKLVAELHGSFAGAFGMPQFEPSSYATYARGLAVGHAPDLESADDAIMSVAYYLNKSGWREARVKSYVRALMKYNNSHDYANAILKLARQAVPAGSRLPASAHFKRR